MSMRKRPITIGINTAIKYKNEDLQLPMQSVAITTDIVSSNLNQGEV
jgi:hypothetical protein